jgi:hypothetical protein
MSTCVLKRIPTVTWIENCELRDVGLRRSLSTAAGIFAGEVSRHRRERDHANLHL